MQTVQNAKLTLPVNGALPPMSVSFNGDRLEISAILVDGEAVDKLIMALNATKPLLPEKAAANSGAIE